MSAGPDLSAEDGADHLVLVEGMSWRAIIGRAGGIVLTAVAAFATGVLFADSSSATVALARYASIWPILLIVTCGCGFAAWIGLWE